MQVVDRFVLARRLLSFAITMLLAVMAFVVFHLVCAVQRANLLQEDPQSQIAIVRSDTLWHPPDVAGIPQDAVGDLIRYGKELIEHTSVYLGPKGKVLQTSNGMNCQNCHLNAGTKPFATNYSAVASTYPKFRHRSGSVEGFEKRINDCIERSLNGKALADTCRELHAMVSYLKWVGKDVERGVSPSGSGLVQLDYLERAADPAKGKQHYIQYCVSCHGAKGQGLKSNTGLEWVYPPLWGDESYNTAAGLFRISKLAGFIRTNMPYGVSYDKPLLSVEEAWDVAAYINSMPRPHKEFAADWPDVKHKPIDHPFGPYADNFPETVHKYGPFRQLVKSKRN